MAFYRALRAGELAGAAEHAGILIAAVRAGRIWIPVDDLLDGAVVTDEAQAVERMGFQAKLVAGDMTNFKVTYPQDIKLAELILGGKL